MYECPDDYRLDPDYLEPWETEKDEDPNIDMEVDEKIYRRLFGWYLDI